MPPIQTSFLILLIAVSCKSSLDRWLKINQGAPSLVIAVNNKALYAITTSRLMQVIHDDTGFSITDGAALLDIAVNEEYGIWITNTAQSIFYRTGVSSSNLKGIIWTWTDGGLSGIATSRYGLVVGHNVHGQFFTRLALSPSRYFGSGWQLLYGALIRSEACTKRVCFCLTTTNQLFTTALMPNKDSPAMPNDWILIGTNVLRIAAYGDHNVWKISTNGVIWEATNVFDENLIHLNWVRRSFQQETFKDISVTNKFAFAIHDNGDIYVQTGCPIFDFEDNDISGWQQTGTAFQSQPVVGQTTSTGKPGKFGDRCIDTFSKRTNYSMPDDATSFQGDEPTGTLLSPVFQIRTNVLHFAIGGGSYPNNYVGLMVDNSEVLQSSGKSLQRTVSGEKIRMSRYWWDVTAYKRKCAQIKLHDLYPGVWGHTLFDDLRASPPCSKGMRVNVTTDHEGKVSVGQKIEYKVHLKGFYTSSLRPLKIKATFPVKNSNPLIFFEKIEVKWTHCNTHTDFTSQGVQSDGGGKPYSIRATLTSLLSDATVHIIARAYDHNDLKVGQPDSTSIKIDVTYAEDFGQVIKSTLESSRFGNETAKLAITERFSSLKGNFIGKNITYKVTLRHIYRESLQRAYNVSIRLLIPGYLTVREVTGLESSKGDTVNIQGATVSVHIPEIEFLDTQRVSFVMQLDGDSKWMIKPGKNYSGHILIDSIHYCPRKHCKNSQGNGIEFETLVKNKVYSFQFQHRKPQSTDGSSGFTSLSGNNKTFVFSCGPRAQQRGSYCYFLNSTTSTWYSLTSVLQNVTYYDVTKRELYGTSVENHNIKLYGDGFKMHQTLSPAQWSDVVAASSAFLKPQNMAVGETSIVGTASMKYQGRCCP